MRAIRNMEPAWVKACGRNFALTSRAQPNVRFLPRNPYKSLTKTRKTPLLMSEVYDLTWYACLLLPESKLSQSSQAYHGFVPKLCHQRGKNTASLKKLRECRQLTLLRAAFFQWSVAVRIKKKGLRVKRGLFH